MLALACSITALAGDTARVLFIGNSFTGTNDLPEQTRLLAASMGDVLIKTSHSPGGVTLQGHSTDAVALSLIDAGGWDYVVLQEQSQIPAFPDAQVKASFYPYAKTLNTRIRLKNPCAKVMFYMTWGYQNGDAPNCGSFPPLCTYESMDSMLRLRYMAVSDSNDAMLCPVGSTWRRIRLLYPSINLYSGDERHPSEAGTYAAACSFYSVLFGRSPVGASYPGSLIPPDAANIQGAAKAVVLDSLAYWNKWWLPTAGPKAAFSNTVTGKTAQFTSSSLNATAFSWAFGDGGSSTAANPSHTYATAGTYTVRLIARSACADADTLSTSIQITATAISSVAVHTPAIYPNPVRGMLQLQGLEGRYMRLQLRDVTGRLLAEETLPAETRQHRLDMSNVTPGLYELILSGEGLRASFRVEKAE